MSVVRIENITKSYGRHTAVSNLSLDVPAGSLYGFIGPNGSGKTSTIRMILRIIHPDEGRIEVLGNSRVSAANDELGYLPEERGLYKKLTVRRKRDTGYPIVMTIELREQFPIGNVP